MARGVAIPRRFYSKHSSRDTDCGEAWGDVTQDQGVRGNHRIVADGHRANDARVASDVDVIADGGAAWSRSATNSAHMMKRTVDSDLAVTIHSDRTTMRD